MVRSSISEVVLEGLLANQKKLPSWLFYDAKGDRIFQEIMHLPEYYLTGCEIEIIQTYSAELLSHFQSEVKTCNIIELGSGDGTKTEILLAYFLKRGAHFRYIPIDISTSVLNSLRSRLQNNLPELQVFPIQGDYVEALANLGTSGRNIFIFMGANIGNFEFEEAVTFIQFISDQMKSGDLAVVGFDMKKEESVIRAAYDDSDGVTARFNMNLLERINRELNANFDLAQFTHSATYNQITGETRSYLISKIEQEVILGASQTKICFSKNEKIHTEISLKYDSGMINEMARRAGLKIKDQFSDRRNYFSIHLFSQDD